MVSKYHWLLLKEKFTFHIVKLENKMFFFLYSACPKHGYKEANHLFWCFMKVKSDIKLIQLFDFIREAVFVLKKNFNEFLDRIHIQVPCPISCYRLLHSQDTKTLYIENNWMNKWKVKTWFWHFFSPYHYLILFFFLAGLFVFMIGCCPSPFRFFLPCEIFTPKLLF